MSNRNAIKLNVLKVRQPIGEFYIASMKASELVGISYADVRRLAGEERDVEKYLGIQRPISKNRVNQIKQYIRGGDATFPTAVILAVDERCAELKDNDSQLTLHAFKAESDDDQDIPIDRIAKIIDGQHRIAAFLDDSNNFDTNFENKDFDFNVAIFVGADVSEQANIFATVNLAQTKVNRSLVYDLTELANTRSPHKTCHNVAVVLDGEKSSPLHHRIKRLGIKTPGRFHEPLTQAGFVESLVKFISTNPLTDRNDLLAGKRLKAPSKDELQTLPFRGLFIKGKDLDIAEIIYNYFSAVKRRWPKSWDAIEITGNLLPKSNAFKALMQFLREDVYPGIAGDNMGTIPTTNEFYAWFKKIDFDDKYFTTKNFSPGSGGQSMFLKMLRGQVGINQMTD